MARLSSCEQEEYKMGHETNICLKTIGMKSNSTNTTTTTTQKIIIIIFKNNNNENYNDDYFHKIVYLLCYTLLSLPLSLFSSILIPKYSKLPPKQNYFSSAWNIHQLHYALLMSINVTHCPKFMSNCLQQLAMKVLCNCPECQIF